MHLQSNRSSLSLMRNSEIYNGNPNGTWGLIFFADNPGDNQYLTLHSWSLTFTAPNISTVTDAQGNYSFTGLPAGTYTVSAADSVADVVTASPQTTTFNLSGDQTASGVNFSVSPAPDLTGVAFNVVSTTTNNDGSLKSDNDQVHADQPGQRRRQSV